MYGISAPTITPLKQRRVTVKSTLDEKLQCDERRIVRFQLNSICSMP